MFGLKLSFKKVEKNVYDVGIGKKAECRPLYQYAGTVQAYVESRSPHLTRNRYLPKGTPHEATVRENSSQGAY